MKKKVSGPFDTPKTYWFTSGEWRVWTFMCQWLQNACISHCCFPALLKAMCYIAFISVFYILKKMVINKSYKCPPSFISIMWWKLKPHERVAACQWMRDAECPSLTSFTCSMFFGVCAKTRRSGNQPFVTLQSALHWSHYGLLFSAVCRFWGAVIL